MSKRTVTIVVSRERLVAKKKRDGRSMYEPAAKRTLIEACLQPGVSIAGMAQAHGINANVLRKWLTLERARRRGASATADGASAAPHRVSAPRSSPPVTAPFLPITTTATPMPVIGARQALHSSIVIEVSGARIVVEGESIDRVALATVIDCLRESMSR
jgi:transposase-like protein